MIDKLIKGCSQLGLEAKEIKGFLKLEYESIPMLLTPDEKGNSFGIAALVVDTQGSLDKQLFEIALNVVTNLHKDYCGSWHNGIPFFSSFDYPVKPGADLDPQWLDMKLKEFWEAYVFLQANMYILCDGSLLPEDLK